MATPGYDANARFPLTAEMVDRLRRLAEETSRDGVGQLSAYTYHSQGFVEIPSGWLIEIIDRMDKSNLPER